MTSLDVTQDAAGIPDFEAMIILHPKELVRENEDQAKNLRFLRRVVSSYYSSATSQLSLYFVQLRLKNKTGLQLKNEKLIISR